MTDNKRRNNLTDQIVEELLDIFQTQNYLPGHQLPPVGRLAEQLGVGRSTLREALRMLQARGAVEIIHGRGTFVTRPRITRVTGVLYGFSEILRQNGLTARSRVLERKRIKADSETAQKLQIPEETEVNFLQRLRLIDQVPVGLETSMSVYERFPDLLEMEWTPETSLYALLEAHYGTIPTSATQRVCATLMDSERSVLLDVEPHSAALMVETVAFDQHGVPFEYGCSWYSGDRYDYYVYLKRE